MTEVSWSPDGRPPADLAPLPDLAAAQVPPVLVTLGGRGPVVGRLLG